MPSSDDLSFEALWSRSSTGTLSHAEFWIRMLELEKKVWGAPENQASLEDCERRIQVLKDWVRAGNEKGSHQHSIQVPSPIWVPCYRVP
jgi:hypothetical protein